MLPLTRVVLLATLAAALVPAYTPAMENQGRLPEKADAEAILKAVCGGDAQVKDTPEGTRMYCSPCPDFTSLHGLTTQQFNLRWVLAGSFTAPGSHDLAAFFEGCEPFSANFGGAVLLNQAESGWKMARYDSALSPLAVHAVRMASGRDLLFAEGNFIGLGLDNNSLYTFDFTQQPVTAQQIILLVSDTARACGYDITRASLDKVAWQDTNFTATVTWGRIKAPPEYLKDCPDKIPALPTQTYTLHFVFDGTAFHPAPDSDAAFNQINQK